MAAIGLAVLGHLARDSRSYEHVIVAAIGLAAVVGLGWLAVPVQWRGWLRGTNGGR